MIRPRLAFFIAGAAALPVVACGGLADPNLEGERTASVSGAITGASVPAGAHVALVWRGPSGLVVGEDVAVVNGHFSMDLTGAPPDDYFQTVHERSATKEMLPSPASAAEEPAATDLPAQNAGPQHLHPQATVSGAVNGPLRAALAGFVLYVDANGNGVLDLDAQTGTSTDTLLGGSDDLLLTYLRGGGNLDLEKLRDKSGILPTRGYNLAWTEERWLPLDSVELTLDDTPELPNAVCHGGDSAPDSTTANPGSSSTDGANGVRRDASADASPDASRDGGMEDDSDGGASPYPEIITCAPDGRSFTASSSGGCSQSTSGLCGGYSDCTPSAYGTAIPDGAPIPAGWPCPVPQDAGLDEDAGTHVDADADVDGGSGP